MVMPVMMESEETCLVGQTVVASLEPSVSVGVGAVDQLACVTEVDRVHAEGAERGRNDDLDLVGEVGNLDHQALFEQQGDRMCQIGRAHV